MLVPKIKTKNTEDQQEFIVREVDENIVKDYRDLYNGIINDDKLFEKYIHYIEKIIRSSFEYKHFIYCLINEFDLTSCKFLHNIDIDETDVTVEFHHYPFTLYDLVLIVLNDKLEKAKVKNYAEYINQFRDPYSIAEEVMRLHYELKVGLVPLTKTAHELVHNGELFIPLTPEYVFGNYKNIFLDYSSRMEEYHNTFNNLMSLTNKILSGEMEHNLDKFNIIKTKIKMQETELPHKINIKEADII